MSKKYNDRIVGISKFKSKAGKDCCKVWLLKPCTDKQNEYGTFGYFPKEEWIPEALQNKINTSIIGKDVEFQYIPYINDYGQPRLEISDIVILN